MGGEINDWVHHSAVKSHLGSSQCNPSYVRNWTLLDIQILNSLSFPLAFILFHFDFLASQDALEVMRVTDWLTDWLSDWLSVSIDFTDVTLVSDDTYGRLYWCDPDLPDSDESYLVTKVI